MSITTNREKIEKLMMGALDNELTAKERQEFDGMLAADESLRAEFAQYKKLKEATTEMKFVSPPTEVWDKYWLGVYNKFERRIGWLILSIGTIILLTYSGFKIVESLFNSPGLAFIAKVGIMLTVGGLAVLFVSVAREKFFTRKHDPYKEIIR